MKVWKCETQAALQCANMQIDTADLQVFSSHQTLHLVKRLSIQWQVSQEENNILFLEFICVPFQVASP